MSRRSFSRVIMMLPPVERISVMYEFACMGLRSKNELVRFVAHLLGAAVDDGDPDRFMKDCGLAVAGGGGNTKAILNRAQRDACIWMLSLVPPYAGLTPTEAAEAMIKSFKSYEARRWPRDRDNGTSPGTPEYLWHWMLREGVKMPKTPWHLAQIIENNDQI